MNGAPLPALHGGPLRVIFPGRYATDSVKWVRTIRAVSAPFAGFYQASRYRRASAEQPAGVPLGALKVQSEIARPRLGDRLPRGMQVDVIGVAWGGAGGVDRVEVSVDGGGSFARAVFIDEERPHCWRRWKLSWTPDAAGPRLLMARATDRQGTAQPLSSDEELGRSYSLSGPDRVQYANNAVPVVAITVT
jgi:sulfite oxidase